MKEIQGKLNLIRVSVSSSYWESLTVHCKVQKEVQGNKTRIVVDNVSGVLTLHPLSESIANRSLPCVLHCACSWYFTISSAAYQ